MTLKNRITRLESFERIGDRFVFIIEKIGGGFELGGKHYENIDEIDTTGKTVFRIPEQYQTPEAWEAAMAEMQQ